MGNLQNINICCGPAEPVPLTPCIKVGRPVFHSRPLPVITLTMSRNWRNTRRCMSYGPSRTMKNVLVAQANSGRIAMGHKGVLLLLKIIFFRQMR